MLKECKLTGLRSVGYAAVAALALVSVLAAADLRLADAAKNGDKKEVAALLKDKVDVNGAEPGGSTPLAWAAERAEDDIAQLLLAAGANPNTANAYGESPLTLACANSDGGLVKALLDAGANAKAARGNGETALMICSGNGNADAVTALLAHGADTAAMEPAKGQNALMWAAAEGQAAVVKILTDHGADVNVASKGNFTPLFFATEKGSADTIKVLVAAGADVNKPMPNGTYPILLASDLKQPAAVTELLALGAKATVADRTGKTPLHAAAQSGDANLVKELLAKGADPNARTAAAPTGGGRGRGAGGGGGFRRGGATGEETPLMVAAKADSLDAMKALVAGGADPKLKAQDGSTLLMEAAGSGHVDVVKYAYELDPSPATVTATNNVGDNAVHASVTGTGGKVPQPDICEVIQFLYDKGVNIDVKNAAGKTALSTADFLPIDEAVDLITALLKKEGKTPLIPSAR